MRASFFTWGWPLVALGVVSVVALTLVGVRVAQAQTSDAVVWEGPGTVSAHTYVHTSMANVAAGPEHLLLVDNLYVTLRTKTGATVATSDLVQFFGDVAGDQAASYDRAIYDPASERFFVVAAGRSFFTGEAQCGDPATCPYDSFLAVSRTSTPRSLGAADWYFYALPDTELREAGTVAPVTTFAAFYTIGVTKDAVVLSSLMYDFVDFPRASMRLRALAKADLISGQPVLDWNDVILDADWPPAAAVSDGTGDSVYLVGNYLDRSCDLQLWELRDPLTVPRVTSHRISAAGACSTSGLPVEPDGLLVSVVRPQSFFLNQPALRDRRLWGAYTIAEPTDPDQRARVRWFELDLSSGAGSARVVQDGRVADESWNFIPAIAVDDERNMALVFTRSSAVEYASAYVAFRRADDPPGTLRAPMLLEAGKAAWGHDRFGYYMGAAADPVDGTVWVNGLYVEAFKTWGTRLAQLDLRRLEPAVAGSFSPAPTRVGVNFVVWSGGSIDEALGSLPGSAALWVLLDGRFLGYRATAPAFANAAFLAKFPGAVVPPGAVIVVVDR